MADDPTAPIQDTEHVVILVHGIRTDAPWQHILRVELEAHGIKVEPTNFGYFDVIRFLIPSRSIRSRAVQRVWKFVRDIRRLYPNAKISFLGHSFGTYIIASILRNEFDFRAHRVVFCGSVVPYNFPFEDIADRFTSPIINEVGSEDHWPAVAESVTWGFGSAGTYGFRRPRVRDRWHNGYKHDNFLTADFCKKYWVPFFLDGSIIEADVRYDRPRFLIRLLSRLKLKYTALFGGLVIASAITLNVFGDCGDRWLDKVLYYECFLEKASQRLYPRVVSSKIDLFGVERFRAAWTSIPNPAFCWYSYHYLLAEHFAERQRTLSTQGYSLVSSGSHVSSEAGEIFQATWTKTRAEGEAC